MVMEKDIQVSTTVSDAQLKGIFKQGGQVEEEKDYPLIKSEECHCKTCIL